MIACYVQNGFSSEAIEMYWKMRSINEKANEVAVMGVISACTQLGDPFFLLLDFSSCHPFFSLSAMKREAFGACITKSPSFGLPWSHFYMYTRKSGREHTIFV
eukprot:TRINITY_DN8712_c0_g1_i5.p1 TRINITY_DN8712_c0_g1~~TRINITY_DN8712_c0_g1_i5.p1  ORF type:complete len:103 (-),score=19.37 TRINITY_DN8712_c0_g1_i5:123-431(-)